AERMAAAGIHIHVNTDVSAIEGEADGEKTLRLLNGDSLVVDEVFYATGRVPKLDGLFADGVSVQTRDNGAVIVDDAFQTSEPGVYALGDVTDRLQLTPVALAEGMWLAAHLFGEHKPK
ncbi:MAG TPA: glutathione-disulfide reductase, partial [Alcanivorax sp.]|nr:glutathione-disulfide reductase [Alcanivorax sp.]